MTVTTPAVTWTARPPGVARVWLGGLVFAVPIGAVLGTVLGVVAGAILAVFQAHRPLGLARTEARGLAALAAGAPVALAFGVPGIAAPDVRE